MTNAELVANLCNVKTNTTDYSAVGNEIKYKGELIAFHDPNKKVFVCQGDGKLQKVYATHEAADLIIKHY